MRAGLRKRWASAIRRDREAKEREMFDGPVYNYNSAATMQELLRQQQVLWAQQSSLNQSLGQGLGQQGSGTVAISSPGVWYNPPQVSAPRDMPGSEVAVLDRPRVDKPTPAPEVAETPAAVLTEYRAMADLVGVAPAEMLIEEFRLFLLAQDMPTFSQKSVVAYMDDLTARDNPSKLGWHWRPVREKDKLSATFGTPSVTGGHSRPSSDCYDGARSPVYTRVIPLHALKKIALVESAFAGRVQFLVTEYTTQPHIVIRPDPFLMAVIDNPGLARGEGRFIIDVWDEPGFGIAQMVK